MRSRARDFNETIVNAQKDFIEIESWISLFSFNNHLQLFINIQSRIWMSINNNRDNNHNNRAKVSAVLFQISFIQIWLHNLQIKTFFVIHFCQSNSSNFHGILVNRNGFTHAHKGKMLAMADSSPSLNLK